MGIIVSKEEELFEEWLKNDYWQHDKRQFVKDGVVDEKTFLEQKCHFVFILKEANQMGKTSLPVFLRDGAPKNGGHTWNPVCKWISGENCIFTPQQRAEILKKIAVVNLKKEDGGAVTDMQSLIKIVERDKVFIKKQLEIYSRVSPVVYICCGPGLLSMINESILGMLKIHRDMPLPFIKPYDSREIYYIAFNHPNCRKSSMGMIDKFKEIAQLVNIDSTT